MPWQNRAVIAVKQQGKGMIAKLEAIADRTAAEAYVGWDIAIHEQQLPSLPTGEYYWRDLIGLRVINHQQQDFGQVSHLLKQVLMMY